MPIYAYRCATCGHAQDVLQKMSDPVLSVCPACGEGTYAKQLTAAGFQLKGSGWYVTDFRDGNKGAAAKPEALNKDAETPAAAAPAAAADGAASDQPTAKAADRPAEKVSAKGPEKSAEKAKTSAAPTPPPPAPSAGG